MKFYLKNHMGYDWFKYILIALACFLCWSGIFSVVDRYKQYETMVFFITAKETVKTSQAEEMEKTAADGGILNFRLELYDNKSKEFAPLLSTQGIYDSDIMILDKENAELFIKGGHATELTDEMLEHIFGSSADPEFIKYEDRVIAVKIYDSKDTEYNKQFNTAFMKFDEGSYYMILNARSYYVKKMLSEGNNLILDVCHKAFAS